MRDKLPDVIELWDATWTKTPGQRGWIGPAIIDPEDPMLATAVAYQRIIRRGGRYVLLYPRRTLDCFGWSDGDLTHRNADGEVIP